MTGRVAAAVGTGLVVLVLVQVTVLVRWSTGAATPDLVVAAVLALGHARGPLVGGVAGAWAGLMLDLVPPAAGPVGGWMLVLALLGGAMGRTVVAGRPGPFAAMALVSLGAAAAVLGRWAVLWFAGVPVAGGPIGVVLASAAWGLLLAPAVLLLAARLFPDGRRAHPAALDGPRPARRRRPAPVAAR